MAKQIIVTKGDYGIEIKVQFVDDKKKPVNIDGQTVVVDFVDETNNVYETKEAIIIDASNGIASVILEAKNTTVIGLHKTYWSCFDDNGLVTAQTDLFYYVKEKNGGANNNNDNNNGSVDGEELIEYVKELDYKISELDKELDEIKEVNVNAEIVDARGKEATLGDRIGGLVDRTDKKYFDDIIIENKRDEESGTSYMLTYIPSGHKINVATSEYYEKNPSTHEDDGLGTNYEVNPKLERATDFSNRVGAVMVSNGGIWGSTGFIGAIVCNGVAKEHQKTGYYSLGFKDNNEFMFFPPGTDSNTVLSLGCKNAISGFIPLVMNGLKPEQSILDLYVGGRTIPAPRQAIGRFNDGRIVFLSCEGRIKNETGMLTEDLCRLLLELGVKDAYMLDGGGSVSTVVYNVLQNKALDNYRTTERKLANFIYFTKECDSGLSDDLTKVTREIEMLKRQIDVLSSSLYNLTNINKGYLSLVPDAGFTGQGIESYDGDIKNTKLMLNKDYLRYWDYNNNRSILNVDSNGNIQTPKGILGMFNKTLTTVTDCDTINETGLYWALTSTLNSPGDSSYAILHIQLTNDSMQVAFPFNSNATIKAKKRRTSGGVFSSWVEL